MKASGVDIVVYARCPALVGFTLPSYLKMSYVDISLPPSFSLDQEGYAFAPDALRWVWAYLNAMALPELPKSPDECVDVLLYLRAFYIPSSAAIMKWYLRNVQGILRGNLVVIPTSPSRANMLMGASPTRVEATTPRMNDVTPARDRSTTLSINPTIITAGKGQSISEAAWAYLTAAVADINSAYEHAPFYIMNSKVLSTVYSRDGFYVGVARMPIYGDITIIRLRSAITTHDVMPREESLNLPALMYVWCYLNGFENHSDHDVNIQINDISTWLSGWRYITLMGVKWDDLFINSYLEKLTVAPLLTDENRLTIRGVFQGITKEQRVGLELFQPEKERLLESTW